MPVKIVADNCCDLPKEMIQALDIAQIHMQLRFGTEEIAPEDFEPAQFYRMMQERPDSPATSQPAVEEMFDVYQQALADGSEVVAVHFSSGMSGTYSSTLMVRDQLVGKERLQIIDSRKASNGLGLMVMEAGLMAQAGASAAEIVARMEEMQRTVRCLFSPNSLEYLVKGGRVSRVKGFVSDVLDIKAILHVDQEGYIVAYDKVRGRKAALKRMLKLFEQEGTNLSEQTVFITHAACEADALFLKDYIENHIPVKKILICEIGPVIGSHAGPGTVCIFFEGIESKE